MATRQYVERAKADIDEVFEAGAKSEYDKFWDAYQQNGKRKGYSGAFSGVGWTAETFKPKYDLIVKTTARNMFLSGLQGVNLEEHLVNLGIAFDTSGVTSIDGFDYFLQHSCPSVMPTIDTRGTTQVRYIFCHANFLTTVRKLIFKEDGSQTLKSLFDGCTALANITIEGKMGANVDIKAAPLTKESIISVVNALYSGATGKTLTLNLAAVNAAFETSAGANDGSTSTEWLALVATKSNWTISLA